MGFSSINDVMKAELELASSRLNSLHLDPGYEVKLRLYGLYKQATEGKCSQANHAQQNSNERAKWEAWNSLNDLPAVDAAKLYVNLVNELVLKEDHHGSNECQSIIVSKTDGVCTILLNRPNKMNALTNDMYVKWATALENAAKDNEVKLVLVTGSGKYFSSGNDLSNFNVNSDSFEKQLENAAKMLIWFIDTFIDFPKPLIAAVNGPAVGIAVTILSLFDSVLAVDNATFGTPFSHLGQSPEGCSSFTFPSMMGRQRANRLLLFGEKITVDEAQQYGLVTKIIPRESFDKEIQKVVKEYSTLPLDTLIHAKRLITSHNKEKLHEVNRMEVALLKERWVSPECINAVMKFMNRKSKL